MSVLFYIAYPILFTLILRQKMNNNEIDCCKIINIINLISFNQYKNIN
jgi:hypothetical protein